MATIEETQDGLIETIIVGEGDVTVEPVIVGESDSTASVGGGDIGATRVDELTDVDITTQGLRDGSVLVYDNNTSKWVATVTLEKQLMNGGFF